MLITTPTTRTVVNYHAVIRGQRLFSVCQPTEEEALAELRGRLAHPMFSGTRELFSIEKQTITRDRKTREVISNVYEELIGV